MEIMLFLPLLGACTPLMGAAGIAFLWWLLGGGLGTAILIFIVLKMLGS